MAELPGKKTKYDQVVKCKWNYTEHSMCGLCVVELRNYCASVGREAPDFKDKEFFVPFEWFHASEKIGCPHGMSKIIKSAYLDEEKN